jgi:hypothetical protein
MQYAPADNPIYTTVMASGDEWSITRARAYADAEFLKGVPWRTAVDLGMVKWAQDIAAGIVWPDMTKAR